MLHDRPVFVGGCPRSGTTLLQVMLHGHPRIAVPPETRFVVEAFRARASFGDLRVADNRERLGQFIVSTPKFRDLGLSRKAVRAAVVAAPPTIGSAVGTVLREYARRTGKPRWGDKRPMYCMDYGLVLRLFPDAQIVHLVRDGRACVASLKQMRWWRSGPVDAMAKWVESVRQGVRSSAGLRADQLLEVRYEDLVAQPEATLRRICGFLGEDFDQVMLASHDLARQVVPERKSWHSRTREPVSAGRVESWRSELTADEIALMEHVAAAELERYGYEPAMPRGHVDARMRLDYERWRRYRAARRAARAAADRAADLRYRHPVAARLTAGQKAA